MTPLSSLAIHSSPKQVAYISGPRLSGSILAESPNKSPGDWLVTNQKVLQQETRALLGKRVVKMVMKGSTEGLYCSTEAGQGVSAYSQSVQI